jgi:hypothetical protein
VSWWCKVVWWWWWWSDFRSSPACICNLRFKGTCNMHDHNLSLTKSNVSAPLKCKYHTTQIVNYHHCSNLLFIHVFFLLLVMIWKVSSKKFKPHRNICGRMHTTHFERQTWSAYHESWGFSSVVSVAIYIYISRINICDLITFFMLFEEFWSMWNDTLLHIHWNSITFGSMVFF